MIKISARQLAVLSQPSQREFVERLAKHLSEIAEQRIDCTALASQALSVGQAEGLQLEVDIAALGEVMLIFGTRIFEQREPAWACAIVADARPDKGRRLRECLAIERRLGVQKG